MPDLLGWGGGDDGDGDAVTLLSVQDQQEA